MATKDGKKSGGRKKGVLNKNRFDVREKVELLGIDPVSVLLFFAGGRWRELGYKDDVITTDHRLRAACELMKYIAPALKAIEHSGLGGGPIETKVVYDTAWRDATNSDNEDPEALPTNPSATKDPSK